MATLQQIRSSTDEQATCAFVLFIEGIRYAFVTDHPGDVLIGSGPSSWIREYEIDPAYSDHELSGQRAVVGGLAMPTSLPRGKLNPNTGMPETTSVTFKISDLEGIIASLFASEGKDFEILGQRVAPGFGAVTSALPVESGDPKSVDPKNGYIGIERLGPARQRRWFFPHPWRGIGLHHQRATEPEDPEDIERHPARTIVQVEDPITGDPPHPIVWAGRQVALYRVYRDPDGNLNSHTSWPHWGEQAAAGGLEWWGVLQDQGEFDGAGTWSLKCFGPESLLRRKMATIDGGWLPISETLVELAEHERHIAIDFRLHSAHPDAPLNGFVYRSSVFGAAYPTDGLLPASGTPHDFAAAIQDVVQAVANEADPNHGFAFFYGSEGGFLQHDVMELGAVVPGSQNQVSFQLGQVMIRRPPWQEPPVQVKYNGHVAMSICLHEKVWQLLGWEVQQQCIEFPNQPTHDQEIQGKKIEAGEYAFGVTQQFTNTPAADYWTLRFTTRDQTSGIMDGGQQVVWKPAHQAGADILDPAGDQDFTLSFGFPYFEGDPVVEAGDYDRARYFAFRGTLRTESDDDTEEFVEEDRVQIARVQWDEQSYGRPAEDTSGAPLLHLDKWAHPRRFGVDEKPLTTQWAFKGDDPVHIKPLNSYAYRGISKRDRAHAVLGQLLLSTGTADGWDSNDEYQFGVNAPPGATGMLNDVTTSELGLGIPHQLVQDPTEMRAAFDLGEAGDPDGPLGQVRYVYGEPFQSLDLIESIIRPRGLALTLRGGRYNVDRFGLFEPEDADGVIDETEVHADINDPVTVVPSQQLRATGAVDTVALAARMDPVGGEHQHELVVTARDPGAKARRGDLRVPLHDDGLYPDAWNVSAGWEQMFRRLWGYDICEWRAKRHFLVKVRLHRVGGQDVWPGTRVRFSNRWVFGSDGRYGVSGAIGVVLNVTADLRRETYACDVLVYADQFDGIRRFAPIARIANPWTGGAEIPIVADEDFLAHGQGDDALRFVEHAGSDVGGNARVVVLEYDRSRWRLHDLDVGEVTGAVPGTVTLAADFTTRFHVNSDKYLLFARWDDQEPDGWVRAHYLPVVQPDHTHSGGQPGFRFVKG